MDECELIHNNNDECFHSTDFHHADCTALLDNSANVHIIGYKRMIIDDVKPWPIGMDVGAVNGSNAPQGIGTAVFIG